MPPIRASIAVFLTASLSSLTAQTDVQNRNARLPERTPEPPKDLDGYFPFDPPATKEAWDARAEKLRMQIRVAQGLWPEPTRTPLNAAIYGRIERNDYTVEKVTFEAMPGFFVTGNLYRPKGVHERMPGILCPHGHWPGGRFMNSENEDGKKALATGAERFESGARSPLQARCVHLARMGCVVFHYDMIGYADSIQLSRELAHGFAKQRPQMNSPENWGLFSPQAEANAQSIMGLQTWSTIRALDFLQSLPDVDGNRLAVTGASGGATQTLIVCALDSRVKVAFPAVMVSTAMQGGCTCENASLLRIGTGNVEIASLFAPKPMAMTAADDWTKELPAKGFPQMQQLWKLLGAPDRVALTPQLQFPHNYNAPSRAAMYRWFNTYLELNLPAERLKERDFQVLTREEMSVWDDAHPAPPAGAEFERKLLHWWKGDTEQQLRKSPGELRQIVAAAIPAIIGREPTAGTITVTPGKADATGLRTDTLKLAAADGESINARMVTPPTWNGWTVLWLDGKGIYSDSQPTLRQEVANLTGLGARVLAPDVYSTTPENNRRVKNPRESAAYTYGYNRTLLARQAGDIVRLLKSNAAAAKEPIVIVAREGCAPLAAVVSAAVGDAVSAVAIDTKGFRFGQLTNLWERSFLPAVAKYGDLPGLLATGAPRPLLLTGESAAPELLSAAYGADAEAKGRLKIQNDNAGVLDWLKELFAQPVTR